LAEYFEENAHSSDDDKKKKQRTNRKEKHRYDSDSDASSISTTTGKKKRRPKPDADSDPHSTTTSDSEEEEREIDEDLFAKEWRKYEASWNAWRDTRAADIPPDFIVEPRRGRRNFIVKGVGLQNNISMKGLIWLFS